MNTRARSAGVGVEAVVARWLSGRAGACATEVRRIPGREAQLGAYPAAVPEWMQETLARRGIAAPYVHQSDAWASLESGRDVVVVTPTASGKTLCYAVPIASMLGSEGDGTALLLYPTKALSQDQCAAMNELTEDAGLGAVAYVYDGDTPVDVRRRVRDGARVVITNPDMMHASILPNHERWRRLFGSLRYVVVDEMHMYRGVFGSHVANVFRRLQRICAHYGSAPRFVFTSATIANPAELAGRLAGRAVDVVTRNGAPAGEKVFVLYNPPIMDAQLQTRQSPASAARGIMARLMRSGHHTIAFMRSRREVEVLTRKLKEGFEAKHEARLAQRTEGYRGGYLPEDRRRIERGLRAGSVQGVVATNALELGLDIGSLDACVIAGFPGTIASTWQQAGRAGRRAATSVAVLVAGDDPVDQYLVNHAGYFFDATPEHARVDPNNIAIYAEHLKCAVFELPVGVEESMGDVPVEDTQDLLEYLSDQGAMCARDGALWRWSGEGYPANAVNIRAIHDENFVIIDATDPRKPKVLGEIDFEAAHKTVHAQAIYQHAARLFEVFRLDYAERKAYVRGVEPEYFTQAIDQTKVFILDALGGARAEPSAVERGWGEVRVSRRFVGYKKIRFKTYENIGYGEIHLPDLEKHTTSYWATFSTALLRSVDADVTALSGAVLGVGRAMHTVALVHLMCAANDLHMSVGTRLADGSAEGPPPGAGDGGRDGLDDATFAVPIGPASVLDDPTVYLYDHCPGGVGFSEKLYTLHDELLAGARALIERCPCATGCPSCVGPAELVTPRGREVALAVLRAATEGGGRSARLEQ